MDDLRLTHHLLYITIALLGFLAISKLIQYVRKCYRNNKYYKKFRDSSSAHHSGRGGVNSSRMRINPIFNCETIDELRDSYPGIQRSNSSATKCRDPKYDRDHDSCCESCKGTHVSHSSRNSGEHAPSSEINTVQHHEVVRVPSIRKRKSIYKTAEQNDEDVFPTGGDLSLKQIFKVEDRSTSKMIGSKNVYSVARSVGPEGEQLVLNNVGISLLVPEGAVPEGEKTTISLVLDWDLTDNPSLTRHQSLVSPVLYVGPHGLQLQKPCVLSFKHCSFDPRMIQVYFTETELLDGKKWSVLCDKDNGQGTAFFTQEECQVRITSFTLYTCVQTAPDGVVGKKWLQIAAFSYPLRPDIVHHQVCFQHSNSFYVVVK